ncbi:MAG TPA: hypothetical protein VK698_20860 [Kofleriaceae bacterium]|nr:hypothetical protein [Kofleriaceae bacterium]
MQATMLQATDLIGTWVERGGRYLDTAVALWRLVDAERADAIKALVDRILVRLDEVAELARRVPEMDARPERTDMDLRHALVEVVFNADALVSNLDLLEEWTVGLVRASADGSGPSARPPAAIHELLADVCRLRDFVREALRRDYSLEFAWGMPAPRKFAGGEAWVLWVALVVGCGGEEGGPGPGDPWIEPIRWPVVDDPPFEIWDAEHQLGTVLLSEQRGPEATIGLVLARFDPAGDRGWEVMTAEEGDCRIYSRGPFFCDPECFGNFCVDGECRDVITLVRVGEVTVAGLAVDYEVDVLDRGIGYGGRDYVYVGRTEAYGGNVFAPDAVIDVSVGGSEEFPAFTGSTTGVEPLEATFEPGDHVSFPREADHVVRWTAGAADDRVRLTLRGVEVGHAAPPQDKLVCDVPDTGMLTIPGAMLGRMPELVTPYPLDFGCVGQCPWGVSSLSRYRTTTVEVGDGTVELVTASEVMFWAAHPGP